MAYRRFALVVSMISSVLALSLFPTAAYAEAHFSSKCGLSYVICKNGIEYTGPNPVYLPNGVADDCIDQFPDNEPDVTSCVRYSGDVIWVKDTAADGHSAVAQVTTNTSPQVTRICRNRFGAGSWAKCNWDWPEAHAHFWAIVEFNKENDSWSNVKPVKVFDD